MTTPQSSMPLSSTPLSSTPRTRLRRYPQRGRTDREELYEVLDAGIVCHFAVVVDGGPKVIPTTYGRDADTLYVHGSTRNSCFTAAAAGNPVCVTVTHVDGLIMARSMFNHSMRFRAAMIYGTCRRVTEESEMVQAMHRTAEQLIPDRWDHVRRPTREEFVPTMVLALPLEEASVKVRDGWPHEEEEDLPLDHWAGVIPLRSTWGTPEPAPDLRPGIPLPEHVARLEGQAVFE